MCRLLSLSVFAGQLLRGRRGGGRGDDYPDHVVQHAAARPLHGTHPARGHGEQDAETDALQVSAAVKEHVTLPLNGIEFELAKAQVINPGKVLGSQ